MQLRTKTSFKAILAMLGTVIGAGVFALPATFQKSGIFAGSIVYWGVALIVVVTHLLYVDIILRTKQSSGHRFPVQAGQLLGTWARRLAFVTHPAQIIGASLVYMILGGTFLSFFAEALGFSDSLLVLQLSFLVVIGLIVLHGLTFVTRIESKVASTLVGLLVLSSGYFFSNSDSGLYVTAHWPEAIGTVGIFLFALFGWQVIPEIVLMTSRDAKQVRMAVTIGSLSAAVLIWVFGIFAYAAIGDTVQADIGNLVLGLPASISWLLPLIGFLAVTSPFLTLTEDLQAMLRVDLKFSKELAWAITFGAPLVLFFTLSRNFLDIVSFMGGFFASINGILICLMAIGMLKLSKARSPQWRLLLPLMCIIFFTVVFIRQLLFFVR